ncbi:MAG: JAB domain-containing protein [Gammaproteobacteria bacterium]|nr:JAB domain-containing protein [Gammaproteobacteria bacterium]
MTLKHFPAAERPRERLLAHGPLPLTDAELLAIFLRTGTGGRDALALARELLARTGGLRELVDLPLVDFLTLPGLGLARYAELQAALELTRRYFRTNLERRPAISGPNGAKDFLVAQFKSLRREVFACLFLDTRHQLIAFEVLFFGTLDATTVHPREVVKRVLELNAAAVILAHNHPSGVAEPSAADQALTRRLRAALLLVDVRVLDHIVAADGCAVSFADRGWL